MKVEAIQMNPEFQVEVKTTSGRGFSPEEVAERCLSKIISVSDNAPPVIRDQAEAFQKLAEENQKASEEFMAANLSKNGIVALPSGIQYRVIEEGEGARPGMDATVKVHYRGSKTDGHEFDSSFTRGVPEEFPVSTVLKGWQEVLPLMKTGATWQVFVPPELAFGARGNPPVGPNEALVFDLKLVEIVQ